MGLKERKEREKEYRREEILKAGEKLFIEKGLGGTTMDEIARSCELAKGTLYLYFKSKEQLFLTIVLRAVETMRDMMAASQVGVTDPVARLARIGQAHQRSYDSNPDLYMMVARFSAHELVSGDGVCEVAQRLHEVNGSVWKIVNDIIIDGMKTGVFKEDTDPTEISMGLHAISMAITMLMYQSKRVSEKSGCSVSTGFTVERLQELLDRNCSRLISTILADPEKYKEAMKRCGQ